MNINDNSFLCGYFSIDGKISADIAKGINPECLQKWIPLQYPEEQISRHSNFFYPEFVDFCTRVRRRYRFPVDKFVSIPLKGGNKGRFLINDITAYLYPYDILLFAIHIEFTDTDADIVLSALTALRNCCFYEGKGLDEFISVCIDPLKRLYCGLGGAQKAPDTSRLVENGNKFKIFHIVESEDLSDEFLFSCATLRNRYSDSSASFRREYSEKIIAENSLKIHEDWKALMLLDTVTFCTDKLSEFIKGIWMRNYCGMIYQYELYRKTYLYRQNLLFRSRAEKPEVLHEQIKCFERKYSFSNISYNFLPNDVDKAIEHGLGTEDVQREVYQAINQEAESMRTERELRSNIFLTFLTCVASFSAVWDISCMVDAMFDYETAFQYSTSGYRVVVSVLVAIIMAVLLITRIKKNKS